MKINIKNKMPSLFLYQMSVCGALFFGAVRFFHRNASSFPALKEVRGMGVVGRLLLFWEDDLFLG